jgi:hypothetical protein
VNVTKHFSERKYESQKNRLSIFLILLTIFALNLGRSAHQLFSRVDHQPKAWPKKSHNGPPLHFPPVPAILIHLAPKNAAKRLKTGVLVFVFSSRAASAVEGLFS